MTTLSLFPPIYVVSNMLGITICHSRAWLPREGIPFSDRRAKCQTGRFNQADVASRFVNDALSSFSRRLS